LFANNKNPNEDSMKRFSALLAVLFALVCSQASAKSSLYVFIGK